MQIQETAGRDSCPLVATIGFFDGVHRGHRYLIEQVVEAARARGFGSAVVTFPVHPRRVMQPDFSPRLLTTEAEKLELLSATGVDRCILLPFTAGLAALSAAEFMALLRDSYGVRVLVVGHDHRFGHNRTEGFADYVRHGEALDMEVLLARAYHYYIGTPAERECQPCDGAVCSSLVRSLVTEGRVSRAAEMLGYDYFLQGKVVGGYRVGRTLGFPTANLRVDDPEKLIPADGVYAVRVRLMGREYGGMLSIGMRPTLANGTERSIEVHIFDFHDDAYDQPLRISFVKRTRDELKFADIQSLKQQLAQDEAEIRKLLLNRT